MTLSIRRARDRVVPAIVTAVALATCHAATAGAQTIQDTYSNPGTYSVAIPQYTSSINVIANGASGTAGSGGASTNGGAGGTGGEVNVTDIPVAPNTFISPGDTLQAFIGTQGAGGQGAGGNELGAGGGNGGQYSSLADQTSQGTLLALAGGGGGGGGGGGIFGNDGGAGGSGTFNQGNGVSGLGVGGGSGGNFGFFNNCDAPNGGGNASGAGGLTDAGGAGGGGDGLCGGSAGTSGGGGAGGGGGGGAGQSSYNSHGSGTVSIDPFPGNGSIVVTFTLSPVAPQITSAASDSVATTAGSVNYQVTSTGYPAPTYSISGAPSWLTIDPNTGDLKGTWPAHTVGKFAFTVTADNGTEPPASQQFSLSVTTPPLALTGTGTLHGNVTSPFTVTLGASGGVAPYTWSVASGSLPSGLKLTSSGQITGTPTKTSTKTFTAKLTDSAVPTAETATEPVTIAIAPRTLTITTATLASAMAGKPYSQTLSTVMGLAPVRWAVASGALPTGLSLNASTGTISGVPTQTGSFTVGVRATDATKPTALTTTRTYTITVKPAIQAAVYVPQGGYSAVLSYALGASGNVSPVTTLAGSATGLNGTGAVAIDTNGRIYVANEDSGTITEYDYGQTGNVAPTATISGSNTGLALPDGLAVDAAGRLYVANHAANSITVYAPGASGNATPVATISGADTGISGPVGLTIDPAGHLWVSDNQSSALTEYASGANGDASPLDTISGPGTGLNGPSGLTIDGAGNLLVANTYGESLLEYSPTASGAALPLRAIVGPNTGFSFPVGVDVDANGNIYVSNQFAGVEAFTSTATGNASPFATISGSNTGLSSPGLLAVAPPLAVHTAQLHAARAGHRYSAQLEAVLGTTPYAWTVTRGRLPHGVHLSRDGQLSGRPDHQGLYRFTVGVRDSSHPRMMASRRLELHVLGR